MAESIQLVAKSTPSTPYRMDPWSIESTFSLVRQRSVDTLTTSEDERTRYRVVSHNSTFTYFPIEGEIL